MLTNVANVRMTIKLLYLNNMHLFHFDACSKKRSRSRRQAIMKCSGPAVYKSSLVLRSLQSCSWCLGETKWDVLLSSAWPKPSLGEVWYSTFVVFQDDAVMIKKSIRQGICARHLLRHCRRLSRRAGGEECKEIADHKTSEDGVPWNIRSAWWG